MKKTHLLIILVVFLIVGCTNESPKIDPVLRLKEFSKVETQNYNLDTISTLLIVGKKGSKVYYKREDFDVLKNEKVILTLREYYDFEDLFFNNINTITDKNELLESSGVLYIEFKSEERQIGLKKEAYIKIEVPEGRLKDNEIFSGKIDSLNRIDWVALESSKVLTQSRIVVEKRGRITVDVERTDTIGYKPGDYFKVDTLEYPIYENQFIVSNSFFINNLKWINLDKYVDSIVKTSFELVTNRSDIELYNYKVYTVYDNLNAFNTLYNFDESLNFDNVSYLKDRTSLIVFGFAKDKIYADKVKLIENEIIKIELKEIDSVGIHGILSN